MNQEESLLDICHKARALIDTMNTITQSPEYIGIWASAWAHGVTYPGPTWGKEFEALQSALNKFQENK